MRCVDVPVKLRRIPCWCIFQGMGHICSRLLPVDERKIATVRPKKRCKYIVIVIGGVGRGRHTAATLHYTILHTYTTSYSPNAWFAHSTECPSHDMLVIGGKRESRNVRVYCAVNASLLERACFLRVKAIAKRRPRQGISDRNLCQRLAALLLGGVQDTWYYRGSAFRRNHVLND